MTEYTTTAEQPPYTVTDALFADVAKYGQIDEATVAPRLETPAMREEDIETQLITSTAEDTTVIDDPFFTYEMPTYLLQDSAVDLRLRKARAITDSILEAAKDDNDTDRQNGSDAITALHEHYKEQYEKYKAERDVAIALANRTFEASVQQRSLETVGNTTQIEGGIAQSDAKFAIFTAIAEEFKRAASTISAEQVQHQNDRDTLLTYIYKIIASLSTGRDDLDKEKITYTSAVKKRIQHATDFDNLDIERTRLRAEENKERSLAAAPTVQQLEFLLHLRPGTDEFRAAKTDIELAVNTPKHPELFSEKLRIILDNISLWKISNNNHSSQKITIDEEIEASRLRLIRLDDAISGLDDDLSKAQASLENILDTKAVLVDGKSAFLLNSSEIFEALKNNNTVLIEGKTIPSVMKPLVDLTTRQIAKDTDESKSDVAPADPHVFYTEILDEQLDNKRLNPFFIGQLKQLPGFISSAISRARQPKQVITFVDMNTQEG
jgi:hypothetical protein